MLHLALKYSNEALKMDPDNVKAVGSLCSCCPLMLTLKMVIGSESLLGDLQGAGHPVLQIMMRVPCAAAVFNLSKAVV